MFDMIMIGDWGEEIDDETATYFLNGYYNNSTDKNIAYVCVGGDIASHVRKYKLQKLIQHKVVIGAMPGAPFTSPSSSSFSVQFTDRTESAGQRHGAMTIAGSW